MQQEPSVRQDPLALQLLPPHSQWAIRRAPPVGRCSLLARRVPLLATEQPVLQARRAQQAVGRLPHSGENQQRPSQALQSPQPTVRGVVVTKCTRSVLLSSPEVISVTFQNTRALHPASSRRPSERGSMRLPVSTTPTPGRSSTSILRPPRTAGSSQTIRHGTAATGQGRAQARSFSPPESAPSPVLIRCHLHVATVASGKTFAGSPQRC